MVFVTGGSGLIGSFLIPELLQRGYPIRASYRGQVPEIEGAAKVEWVEGDVLDTAFLRKAIQGVQYVFHCAGLVSYDPQDKNLLKHINVEGTANLVDVCLENNVLKLCHVSSVAAVGRPKGQNILTEDSKWDQAEEHSAYASSKYFGELEVWRGVAEGLKAVIVNPSVVLGPADWSRSSTRLFKYVHDQHLFYTGGQANFVDVRDVINAMINLTFADITGERFILNAGQLSYKEFFDTIASYMQKKSPSVKVPPVLAEIIWRAERFRSILTGARPLITKETARVSAKSHFFSNNKVKQALKMEFRSLPDTIAWTCSHLMTNAAATGAAN